MACNTVPNPNVAGAAPKYNPTGACYVFDVGVPEWFAGDGTENTLSLNGVNVTMEEVLGTVEDGVGDLYCSYGFFFYTSKLTV